MERGRRPPPARFGPAARPPVSPPAGPGRRPEPRVPAPLPRGPRLTSDPSTGLDCYQSPQPYADCPMQPSQAHTQCQLLALPGAPPPLCHGRLGFLGMGFAACHKSHCQGFPTDPEPCLWGHRCHCFR
ncbi:splicing factor 3B subunit 4-like [Pseudorca crassidens]|uniref:splicing factor 3B subunit 4-like n=1 Tax=Pseudorca crassidens TaxID=82174 RepID=UPI00352ED392